ncbi:MAG: fibronectin type III domain-containing protein [Thermoflexales bacterium]
MPGAFGKSSPSNGATNRKTTLTLSWGASSGATSYEVCVDTTNDNTCAGAWTNVGSATSGSVSGLSRNTTYYWQVRANNAVGQTQANGVTWWNFKTR